MKLYSEPSLNVKFVLFGRLSFFESNVYYPNKSLSQCQLDCFAPPPRIQFHDTYDLYVDFINYFPIIFIISNRNLNLYFLWIMAYGQVKVALSHHNREADGGFVSCKPLAFLLNDNAVQDDSKKKKRKLQLTTKKFGAFVSISAAKNAEHLALAWRVRHVWGCGLSWLHITMTKNMNIIV